MKKSRVYVIASLVTLIAAATPSLALAGTELARINGTVISLEEFNQRYKEGLKFLQFKTPSKKLVLDDMIKRELAIQEARRLGLDKDPAVVERINTVLYHALLDKKLSKEIEAIHITEGEAKDFYAKNPEIRTSHIFVGVAPDATPEKDKEARQKIEKIKNEQLKDSKMSFAEVAQRFSEGIAAPMGGDIDFQTRDKLDPAYYEAAIKLRSPGKVSDIVRSQFGYHIIKLTAIRPWADVDKALVKRMAFDERRAQVFDKFMNQLRSQSKVTTHGELLGE